MAGCADSRTAPPNVNRPTLPHGTSAHKYPALGVDFRTPSDWSYREGSLPLVATTSSGQAVVAVWRYPRTQPLPRTLSELRAARHALVGAAREHDPTFTYQRAQIVDLNHQPAVVLVGRETIAGQPRAVRSTHVYAHGAEYVIDALAPAGYFARVDAAAFMPLIHSVRFWPPVHATGSR